MLEEPQSRLLGLRALATAGENGLEAAHRLRADGGIPGAAAAMWLVEQGVIDPSTVELNEMLLGLVDHLAAMLQHGLLLDELDQQPIAEQIVLVKQLEHADHPYLLDVLDAIAAEHSNHKVARAAKKIRLKLRST